MIQENNNLPSSGLRPRLALIAHERKRDHLVEILRPYLPALRRCNLIATRETGTLCSGRLGLSITVVNSATRGGDLEVGALIAEGQIDALVYLRDPISAMPYEQDAAPLFRVSDVHDVPFATNEAAARIVLMQLDKIVPGCGIRERAKEGPDHFEVLIGHQQGQN